MTLKPHRPTSSSQRHYLGVDLSHLQSQRPVKRLTKKINYRAGRNAHGRVTVRHRGGQHKRLYRIIDFKRDKKDIPARVARIEYDPNRSVHIALLYYLDGEKRYILAPQGLKLNQTVITSDKAPIKPGNCLLLKNIPEGTVVHNLELTPGKGGQVVRSAGSGAILQAKDKQATLKLPSGEVRLLSLRCSATIGTLGNVDFKNIKLGKAGRKRHLGFRPAVRGVAMHPAAHPHGGGEGRSGVGMPSPLSPWGKKTLGKKTRSRQKYSNKFIIKDRRKQ
jgi:large subunit ribosomal protein L2